MAATVFWRKDRAGGGPAVEVSPGTRLMVVERSSDFAGMPVVRVRDESGREFGDVHWDWLRPVGDDPPSPLPPPPDQPGERTGTLFG